MESRKSIVTKKGIDLGPRTIYLPESQRNIEGSANSGALSPSHISGDIAFRVQGGSPTRTHSVSLDDVGRISYLSFVELEPFRNGLRQIKKQNGTEDVYLIVAS